METVQRKRIACPLCSDERNSPLFSQKGLDFVRCAGCRLVYINPQPTDEEISALYGAHYYAPWGLDADGAAVETMKVAAFSDKLKRLELFAQKGKILDIGCATGFFLQAARERGWDAYGVELSSYSAPIAQERFGKDRVFNGTLEEAGYEENAFDVVFMSDLIEHIKELKCFLNEVRRIVRPGGLIAVITPDAESLSCRIMGRHWPHYKMEHLYYFSVATLTRIFEEQGFEKRLASSSTKVLTPGYLGDQLTTYPIPLVTPLLKIALSMAPGFLRRRQLKIPSGELLFIAEKRGADA